MKRWGVLLAVILLIWLGCARKQPLSEKMVVVLADSFNGTVQSSICVIDPASGKIARQTPLPIGSPRSLARDPLGRYWVGYASSNGPADRRLLIFSPKLNLLKTIATGCANPGAGIAFSSGKAFVGCIENGVVSKLAVLDLQRLQEQAVITITLQAPSGPSAPFHYLTALAADESRLVAAAMTPGPDPARRYALVTVIDTRTNRQLWQSKPLEDSDIWQVLPYQGDFLLLNVASAEQKTGQRADYYLLHPDFRFKACTAIAAPLWGAVQGELLFTFHNPSYNAHSNSHQRLVARRDLKSGATVVWPLPDHFDSAGLVVQEGSVLLGQQHLQRLDLASGNWSSVAPEVVSTRRFISW